MTAPANQDPDLRSTEAPPELDWSALMAQSQEGDGQAYRRLLQ